MLKTPNGSDITVEGYQDYILEIMKQHFRSSASNLLVEIDSIVLSMSDSIPALIASMRKHADEIKMSGPFEGFVHFTFKGHSFSCTLRNDYGRRVGAGALTVTLRSY